MKKSLQGHFLIASPQLPDDNFSKSVVLMVQHDQGGALGLVLNRPSSHSVKELWERVGEGETACARPVYVGGPCEGPLMVVHLESRWSEVEIVPGLYFAAERTAVSHIVTKSEKPYRLFLGYSGWGGGQLEGEMQQGAWLTFPATREYVFETDDDVMWQRVTGTLGREFLTGTLGLKAPPEKPWLN